MHLLILLCVFIPMVFIFVGGVECLGRGYSVALKA